MTSRDGRKQAIRERMAATGEPYRRAQRAVEAEAFAARVDGIPLEEQGIRALPPTATPAERAHAEAVWRATADPGRRCLCSGIGCKHGRPCDPPEGGDGCPGRLAHADRFPGSVFAAICWADIYVCDTCGEQLMTEVELPEIPWAEQDGNTMAVYPGVRHPNFREGSPDDVLEVPDSAEEGSCPTCGCWCYGCGCAEAAERAEGYDDDLMHYPAHCCECGRTGTDCEYNCRCSGERVA
ncbi:hypothetical protein [Nocardia brasiliensis]|uniref:hypothetical protein n=1 Tax=Nocardia brasiliensis TaxID=37326 RepID=UPI002454B802|nr:hypothetical protein [Nocardia brasiliensis]